jgi:hypothetical protein
MSIVYTLISRGKSETRPDESPSYPVLAGFFISRAV